MAKRIKTPATPVPQSRDAAEQLAGELVGVLRQVERINSDLALAIVSLKLRAKAETEPLGRSVKSMFAALASYAQANRGVLLEHGGKSVNFAAGTIGWRFGSPAVEIADGMEEAVIDYLEQHGLQRFLRETIEIDKQAILAESLPIRDVPGLTIGRTENFFFKPLEIDKEQTKVVAIASGVGAHEEAA